MNTDTHRFEYKNETREIIGCSMEVLNELGHGLLEKPYENALCVEFRLRNIHFIQQARCKVFYKDVQVGEYIPDLVVFGKIVSDTKVIDRITDHEIGQMLNYPTRQSRNQIKTQRNGAENSEDRKETLRNFAHSASLR